MLLENIVHYSKKQRVRENFSRESAPNGSAVQRMITNFDETGSIMDARPRDS